MKICQVRKSIIAILLTFGFAIPAKADPYLTNDIQFDGEFCNLYTTQPEAQRELIDYYSVYRQTNKKIDINKNGIACEHLPGWFSFIDKSLWHRVKYNLTDNLNVLNSEEDHALELAIMFNTLPQRVSANRFKFKSNYGTIWVNYTFDANGDRVVAWKEELNQPSL